VGQLVGVRVSLRWRVRGDLWLGVGKVNLRGALRIVRELQESVNGRGLLRRHFVRGRLVDQVRAATMLRVEDLLVGGAIGRYKTKNSIKRRRTAAG